MTLRFSAPEPRPHAAPDVFPRTRWHRLLSALAWRGGAVRRAELYVAAAEPSLSNKANNRRSGGALKAMAGFGWVSLAPDGVRLEPAGAAALAACDARRREAA